MVAAAALTLSVSTSLAEWKEELLPNLSLETPTSSEPQVNTSKYGTWPLSLITEITSCKDETDDGYPSLEVSHRKSGVLNLAENTWLQ